MPGGALAAALPNGESAGSAQEATATAAPSAPTAVRQLDDTTPHTSGRVQALPVAQQIRTVDEVTSSEFQTVALESELPVIVDFYGDYCGPCKVLAPMLDRVARERGDIRVVKVNVSRERALASQYRVTAVPTVILLKDGELVGRFTGLPQIQRALGLR